MFGAVWGLVVICERFYVISERFYVGCERFYVIRERFSWYLRGIWLGLFV